MSRVAEPERGAKFPRSRLLAVLTTAALMGVACHRVVAGGGSDTELALSYELHYDRAARVVEVAIRRGACSGRHFKINQGRAVSTISGVRAGRGGIFTVSAAGDGVFALPEDWQSVSYRYGDPTAPLGFASGFGGTSDDGAVFAGRNFLLRPLRHHSGHRVRLEVNGGALTAWGHDEAGNVVVGEDDLIDFGIVAWGGSACEGAWGETKLLIRDAVGPAHTVSSERCQWIVSAAKVASRVAPQLPYASVSIGLIGVRDASPSPFGTVLWSHPPSVAILVGTEATPTSFRTDWVALHELMHLIHPAFVDGSSWLMEGVASYQSELARALAGDQSCEAAWNEMRAQWRESVIEVGNADFATVTDSSKRISYHSMYWAGALFAAELDAEIFRATDGRHRFASILVELARRRAATIDDLAVEVRMVTGRDLVLQLLKQYREGSAFARWSHLEQALSGLHRGEPAWSAMCR